MLSGFDCVVGESRLGANCGGQFRAEEEEEGGYGEKGGKLGHLCCSSCCI